MITIVDYGVGNVKSIQNMLKRMGEETITSKSESEIKSATKIILPGVGAFDYGMTQLKKSGLIPLLNQKVLEEKIPTLGICLGAQMLGKKSDEGEEPGLGWIDMDIVRFDSSKMKHNLKIPHMSWNEINIKKDSPLLLDLDDESRFYFVHSYHMLPKDNNDILCVSNYGYEFISGVSKNNIYGVQFHPEKSHKFGMKLLENFSKI